jgi:tripartite-type tricarboxylate transporter receptor subunit TctC
MSHRTDRRRRAILLGAMGAAFLPAGAAAQSAAWPNRPVRIIVPHAPGGVTDVVTRLLAQPLAEALGQSVLVENRPGAAGLLGTDAAAKAVPDGYTLLMFVDTNTIFPSTVKQLNHDPASSFAPISILGRGSHVLVAHPSIAATNLQELVAYVRQRPRELSYATPGTGSPQHLGFEIIRNHFSLDVVHIPYKGGGQAIGDVVGGQVRLGMLGMAPALPHVKAGKLKAIAVTGRNRSGALPETPTVAESGVPGFETGQWQGIVAPAGTPPAVIERLHGELLRIMRTPAVAERMAIIGMDSTTSPTPDAFAQLLRDELKRWPAVVRAAGIQPE